MQNGVSSSCVDGNGRQNLEVGQASIFTNKQANPASKLTWEQWLRERIKKESTHPLSPATEPPLLLNFVDPPSEALRWRSAEDSVHTPTSPALCLRRVPAGSVLESGFCVTAEVNPSLFSTASPPPAVSTSARLAAAALVLREEPEGNVADLPFAVPCIFTRFSWIAEKKTSASAPAASPAPLLPSVLLSATSTPATKADEALPSAICNSDLSFAREVNTGEGRKTTVVELENK